MDISLKHKAERVLGKAVHQAAIDRLFEIWPSAEVEVKHSDGRHDGVDLKITHINIFMAPRGNAPNESVFGRARCRLDDDQWDRKVGIKLAFNRALKAIPR